MRTAAAIVAVSLLSGAGAGQTQRGVPAPPPVRESPPRAGSWEQFDIWLTAVEQHAIGHDDAALRSVLALPADDLESLFSHMVFTLRGACARERRSPRFDELFGEAGRRQPPQARRAELMVDRIARIGVDKFVKRAAMLHTDIAVVAPDAQRSLKAGKGRSVSDGRGVGDEGRVWHWLLARAFLHLVPKAEQDADVRLWYQVAASYLWSMRQFTEAVPHIKRATEIFPRDAEIQFVRGLIHEAQGAPHIQAAVAQEMVALSSPTTRYVAPVKSSEREYDIARDAFQQAVEIDPRHAQARIRLGRLLVLDGRAERAVIELRRALDETSDPAQRYLAQLFLGRAHETLGQFDAARQAYEAAADAFPGAQSPRMALSLIALQTGDRETAQQLFAFLSTPPGLYADPWWDYHHTRAPNAAVLLARLLAAFEAAVK